MDQILTQKSKNGPDIDSIGHIIFLYMSISTHAYTHTCNMYIHKFYIYSYIHTHIHLHTSTYIYIYFHIHTYICIHTYIYTHTHIHLHTYSYIYIHLHLHTYIHTYIHTFALSRTHNVPGRCMFLFCEDPVQKQHAELFAPRRDLWTLYCCHFCSQSCCPPLSTGKRRIKSLKWAEYCFGEHGFKHRSQWVFLPSPSSGERAQWVPLSLFFVPEQTHRVSSQNSPSLPQNSVRSLFWNSTLKTVFPPFLKSCRKLSDKFLGYV